LNAPHEALFRWRHFAWGHSSKHKLQKKEKLTMFYPLDVQIQLENIHCFDEGDFIGSAEPYLWVVFFKIDGDTVFVDESLTLQGTATVVGTPGNQGDLPSDDVDAGDDVSVPAELGEFRTVLTPIPLRTPIAGVTNVDGVVGCIVILMEEDETENSAIAAGHNALNNAVQTTLNSLIPTLNFSHQSPTKEDIDRIKKEIASAVGDAISNDTSVWDWLSGFGDMDDQIGSEFFTYSHGDLLSAGPGGIALSKRWHSEGDWQITGHVYVKWSDWEDLGGTLASAPAAASWQENRLDCFARGTNNHMLHKWWDGSAWSDWEDLGGPPAPGVISPLQQPAAPAINPFGQQLTSAPAAVSWGPNRIDCFGRGKDGHMWHKWWGGSAWSDWEDQGGNLTSAPAATSWGPNRIDCFVRGTNTHMWHKWWDGSAWSDWEDLGGDLTSAPAATSWGPNRIDCFVRGTNTHMWHKWWDGSAWSDWEDLGGGLSSSPAAASRQENRLDCFVRGTDNHMWHKWWDGSTWSDWEDQGGILTDAPTGVSWGPNRVDCFVRGTDNHMWHKWWPK
jgi:hypothetical protein